MRSPGASTSSAGRWPLSTLSADESPHPGRTSQKIPPQSGSRGVVSADVMPSHISKGYGPRVQIIEFRRRVGMKPSE